MTAADLTRYVATGDAAVDRALRYWGSGSLLPKQYRLPDAEGGGVNWPNLTIAATALRRLDVDPFNSLPDTYVVGGRLGMMHGLQVALAQRADVFPDVIEGDDTYAVVQLEHGASWGCPACQRGTAHISRVTMEQATKAGWPKRNPNYATMPDRMLAARAMTLAIDRHAPGVLRGIASALANVATLETEGDPVPGEGGVGQTPPASPDLAGYYRTEIPGAMRSELLARIRRLDDEAPEVAAELRAEWKSLRGPVIALDASPLDGRERWSVAYLPDALVLRYMLDEVEGALAVAGGAVRVPSDTHDAAPESRGMEPDDDQQYDGDDPARPF